MPKVKQTIKTQLRLLSTYDDSLPIDVHSYPNMASAAQTGFEALKRICHFPACNDLFRIKINDIPPQFTSLGIDSSGETTNERNGTNGLTFSN